MKNFYLLVAATIFLWIPGFVHSGGWVINREGPFKGRIIDAETKEPVEGAVIVAQYHARTLYPIGWRTDLKDVQEALTNEKGEFFIPKLTMRTGPLSVEDDASFLIWKPGYKRQEIWGGYFFAKDPGTVENRPTHTDQGLELKPVRLGIIELLRLNTKEERLRNMPSPVGDLDRKQKALIRAINEERKYLGLKGQLEIREE